MKTVRQQVGMALIIGAVIGVALAMLGLALMLPPSASAACPAAEELFCSPLWTKAMQAQKNRVAFLDARIAEAKDRPWLNLSACDSACIANYDASTRGVLGALAKKNDLDYNKVVLAYIITWDKWGAQAEKDLRRKLTPEDMNKHFVIGLNDFADELRVNHALVQLDSNDETKWCVAQEYGGVCSGKW